MFQNKILVDGWVLMGDSTMFLTPPNSTMGGLLPHFLCSKLRVLTICYRLETSYISILGLLTYIKRKKYFDRAQRGPRMVAIFTAVSPKSAKISEKQGSNYRNLSKIGMEVWFGNRNSAKKDRTIERFLAAKMTSSIF